FLYVDDIPCIIHSENCWYHARSKSNENKKSAQFCTSFVSRPTFVLIKKPAGSLIPFPCSQRSIASGIVIEMDREALKSGIEAAVRAKALSFIALFIGNRLERYQTVNRRFVE
ncbi:hypothetical protein K0M31_012557, partial [Melipona bicolor]